MRKVLIVDDHAIVRSGLQSFFQEEAHGYVLREAATGEQALDLCRAEPWDMVVLDRSLPSIGGQAVLHQLQQECPGLPVLMLSFALEADHVLQSLAGGAAGYIAKEELSDHLLPAIEAALAGRRYLSPGPRAVLGQDADRYLSAA
jgi:two-component system, NarL family, invasion response regulator UvrY